MEQANKLGSAFGYNNTIISFISPIPPSDESKSEQNTEDNNQNDFIVIQYVWRGSTQKENEDESAPQDEGLDPITRRFSQLMRQRENEGELGDDALLFTFLMGNVSNGTNVVKPAVGLMRELAPQIAESFALSI